MPPFLRAPVPARGLAALALAVLAPAVAGCGGDETGGASASEPIAAAPAGAPNVLVVVTDDQRDGQMRFMPRIRRQLGERGTTFTDAYVTTPLCCPSRGSIFSGKYVHNHGIIGNPATEAVANYDLEDTWPEVLRENGYRTGLAGKFLNHWPRDKRPRIFDFYEWADGRDARKAGKRIDDLRVAGAERFLRSTEEDDRRPWTLTLALHAPHTSYDPPPRYEGFDAGPFPRNPATRETDLSDKAAVVRELQARNRLVQESWNGQARTLRATDDLLGGLFNRMRKAGEMRDTLVVFISDNGYMTGEHGLTKKVWPYPASIGVPLILRWQGEVGAGERSDHLVANIDIAATVFDATGIDPDYTHDGRSLLSGEPREWLLLEGPRMAGKTPWEAWDAYLDHETHFIQWQDDASWRELYDLGGDPFELENLLADPTPESEALAADLEAKIAGAVDCAGDTCP